MAQAAKKTVIHSPQVHRKIKDEESRKWQTAREIACDGNNTDPPTEGRNGKGRECRLVSRKQVCN